MRTKLAISIMALSVLMVGADTLSAQRGGGGRGRGGRGGLGIPPLMMQTDAWEDGGIVPDRFAGRGGNVQPGFTFTGAPDNTVAYAIIFHDIDVVFGGGTDDVLHWMVWDIPAEAGGIPEGSLPDGAVSSTTNIGRGGYFGPGAPAGERYHHYVFELYALSEMLNLPPETTRAGLLEAMAGKIVAKSAYVGRYHQ